MKLSLLLCCWIYQSSLNAQLKSKPGLKINAYENDNDKRQEAVKQTFLHAWNGYKKYAWGSDEVGPLSNTQKNDRFQGWGATLVDSMSTLWIMGLHDEFDLAARQVQKVNFTKAESPVLFFETIIRFLGGLISAYDLSEDRMLLNKAISLADKLLPAFDSPSGYPYGSINFSNNVVDKNKDVILAEIGTCQLEFVRLSKITGDSKYAKKAMNVFDQLDKLRKPAKGLYPVFLDPKTGNFATKEITFGALGDSFYEYLIKVYALTNKQNDQLRRMYLETIDGFKTLVTSGYNNLKYFVRISSIGIPENIMDHLSLFMGGLLQYGDFILNSRQDSELGLDLTKTGYEFYRLTKTKLAPETMEFSSSSPMQPVYAVNYLRPELLESLFYSWRFTKNPIYRDQAWEILLALNKYSKTPTAYACYQDVENTDPKSQQIDIMESFFFAESLKYLYLIFSDDSALDLNRWVLNTEAHPLKIPAY